MNGMALLGIFLLIYGLFVLYIGLTKKPAAIWAIGKIQGFVRVLGERGTQIFFVIFGLAVGGLGIWLLTK